jgi:hypothetical protein
MAIIADEARVFAAAWRSISILTVFDIGMLICQFYVFVKKWGKKKGRFWRLYGLCGTFSLIVSRRSFMLTVGECVR